MRLKTFISTYLLFVCILFASVGIVSVYMSNSQTNMLREHSANQFQTIVSALNRDITLLKSRDAELAPSYFNDAVNAIILGYARYYARSNVHLSMINTELSEHGRVIGEPELSIHTVAENHYIHIIGALPAPLSQFVIVYSFDITENIADMQDIQRILLVVTVFLSIAAAFALHFILASIFKPLAVVADASKKISDGEFGERIHIKGKNELARVAVDFNKMAQTIENQIAYLEEESLNKQQFVDNFAHEIRTPLTSIHGYAQYLQKARVSESEIIESAECIMTETAHMNNVAGSLLELATLRNYTPVKTDVAALKLFDDVSHTLENTLHKNNTKLVINSDENTIVHVQEDLIKSLLLNLCMNAIRACSACEGEIQLDATAHEDCVIISVSDNGCGIPEESLPKVCEPFYRVDKARSRENGGVGIGLSLCNQIVLAHDAEMSIHSIVGVGTIVEIRFTTP